MEPGATPPRTDDLTQVAYASIAIPLTLGRHADYFCLVRLWTDCSDHEQSGLVWRNHSSRMPSCGNAPTARAEMPAAWPPQLGAALKLVRG